jgi:hypothetical protein
MPRTFELPVVVHPKRHAAELNGTKSIDSKVETSITFENRSKRTIKVHWLDFEGNRQLKRTVAPGATYASQRTFLTHPWLVTDQDDNPWHVYYPDAQPRSVEVREPAAGAPHSLPGPQSR